MPLFAALLSSCYGESYTESGCGGGTFVSTQLLTPEEYAKWKMGMPPGMSMTAEATTNATTDGSTTDGSTTGDATTGDATTGAVIGTDAHGVAPAAAGWLARAAHDEAASIAAFEALGDELARHAAPAGILAAIADAAADERRHAAITEELSRRLGVTPRRPTIVAAEPRGLLEITVENAVEGCVVETWAALVNAHQARSAADPEVRALYTEIAADEARHAELAWAIHTCLMGQLDERGRREVLEARRAAVDALARTLATVIDDPALVDLGVPPCGAARALVVRRLTARSSRRARRPLGALRADGVPHLRR